MRNHVPSWVVEDGNFFDQFDQQSQPQTAPQQQRRVNDAPNPAFFNPDGSPRAVLSAGPEPSSFQRLIDSLQEIGLIPKGQANQIRRNSRAIGAAARAAPREATFGLTNFAEAGLDAINPASQNFGEFSQALEQVRNRNETDRQLNPNATAAGGILGGVLGGGALLKAGVTASRAIPQGISGLRGALARGGAAATDGAVIGGTQALSNGEDIANGALLGAVTAGGLQGGAEAITGVAGNIAKRIERAGLSPQQRVNENVLDQVNAQGGRDVVQQQLNANENRVLADILPGGGRQLRTASNFSPEAQDIALERLVGRRSEQNERLVEAVENAAGVNGQNQTVDDLQDQIRNRFQPRVSQAFNRAREGGAELNSENIDSILQGPLAQQAQRGGNRIFDNQVARQGPESDNQLSRLHSTIRRLGGQGNKAQRDGEDDLARENFATQSDLRNAVDDALDTPDFQNARRLSQRQFQRQDAVQSGADAILRPNRANRNALNNFDERFRVNQRQGAAVALSDALEQNGNTASALSRLNSPGARRVIETIFDSSQQNRINQAFNDEREFNRTLNAVTGNSTTAQQQLDSLNGENLQNVVDAISNIGTGGISGSLRSGARALAGSTIARSQRENAPFVADVLTQRQIPESVINRLSPEQLRARQQIIDLLSRTGAIATN